LSFCGIAISESKGESNSGGAPLKRLAPEFQEREEERNRMVSTQIERDRMPVTDKGVLNAMRSAPRHLFVPSALQTMAYADRPLPVGYGQTISQPFIVAYMTEKLELSHGDKVLEIGTGSGYQAAVLAYITPHVYTVEIIRELGEETDKRLKKLGYNTVSTKVGDGYFGWEEHAPYDAIIVTCAAGHAPPELIKQLRPGGRMIIPVGGVYEVQMLMLVIKDDEGKLKTRPLIPVRFVPMTGKISGKNNLK